MHLAHRTTARHREGLPDRPEPSGLPPAAIRELIKRGGTPQEEFEFLQEHQIIRDLSSYGHIVRASMSQDLQPLES
jgi:hypothetical protein